MRILFSSTFGPGHLQPLLPYAQSLLQRGHEVLVSAPEKVSATLQKAGLPHSAVDFPSDESLGRFAVNMFALPEYEGFVFSMRERFVNLFARTALPKLQESIRSWKPNLIVRESCEYAAAIAANLFNVPSTVVAVLNPAAEDIAAQTVAEPIDQLRQEIGIKTDNRSVFGDAPVFTAFPASLDQNAESRIGHPPFRMRMPNETIKSDTMAPPWLPKDDVPLIYISFGTTFGLFPQARALYRIALDAVSDLPVRALLTTGPNMDPEVIGKIPKNVTVEAWVPQSRVWPHTAALISHGGSGTMLGGLAAGVPMVLTPLFADQPFNARSVEVAGAGLAVFNADAPAIHSALQRLLNDAGMGNAARRIAHEIAKLPSLDDAIDTLMASAQNK